MNNVLQKTNPAMTNNFNANPGCVYRTRWFVTLTSIALTGQTKQSAVVSLHGAPYNAYSTYEPGTMRMYNGVVWVHTNFEFTNNTAGFGFRN